MARLTEEERQTALTDVFGHYEQLLTEHPGWEIEPGLGLTQLRAQGAIYNQKVAAINAIVAAGMPAKRAQRDAIFGTSAQDSDGVWVYLGLYKSNLRLHLKRVLPPILAKSLGAEPPNIGPVRPGTYDAILESFINHWQLVNDACPPAKPLVLSELTLQILKDKRAEIAALSAQIDETVLTRLAVMRAEREQFFGDVREEERENDSILARLLAYETEVATQFAGTPLAQTLPRIFPETGATLPRFPFNFRQAGSDVVAWFEVPEDLEASVVYLKEGAFEESVAMPSSAPFKVTFSGVAVVEGVDELELRDSDGKTLAHGKFDGTLIEPL